MPGSKASEIEQLIVDTGLQDHRSQLAQNLSGGNKRKLSVALALVAQSKFVLLDEPSSGLDLEARRKMWTLLKKYKKDRIVILTTHYMDEADILGDRVGVIANGKLTCVGSSLFLKNKFGLGYNLTILLTAGRNFSDPISSLDRKVFDLISYLRLGLGGDVLLQSRKGNEIKFQIPKHLSEQFSKFFVDFEYAQSELGVESYSLSISTLEEVFLRIGHLEDPSSALNSAEESVEQPKSTMENLAEPLSPTTKDKTAESFIIERDEN